MNFPQTIDIYGVTYTLYDENQPDRLIYHGADHTDRKRQKFEVIRTAPKRSGYTMSKRRLILRLTRDVTVDLLGPDAVGTSIEPDIEYYSKNIPGAYASLPEIASSEAFIAALAGLTAGTINDAATKGNF